MQQLKSTHIALILLLAHPGCSDETGVLISVSGAYVEELEFWVGVQRGEEYYLDQEVSGQRRQVRGRNLSASPYELMLREPSSGGQPLTVSVLVFGYVEEEGQEVAKYFAFTFTPQQFIRGEVVRRSLRLRGASDYSAADPAGEGCFRVWKLVEEQKEFWLLVASDRDKDCDGYSTDGQPPDCNDQVSSAHPNATELCDGHDNNCDGKFYPSSQVCYAYEGDPGICRQGTRACGDASGSGWAQCSVNAASPQMAESYCYTYDECRWRPDPAGCVQARLEPLVGQCSVEQDPNGLCADSIPLVPPLETGACEWVIVDDGGLVLGLSDGQTAPASSINICEPQLVLDSSASAGATKVVLEFFGGDAGTKVVELSLSINTVDTCGTSPVQCS